MKIKIASFILLLIAFSPISYAHGKKPDTPTSLYETSASKEYATENFATGALKSDGFKGNLDFNYGVLNAGSQGTVTFTFLGSDASYTNYFNVAGVTVFNTQATPVGSTFSELVSGNGVLNFSFYTAGANYTVTNAQNLAGKDNGYGKNEGTFGIVSGDDDKGTKINGTAYQYLLVYNDPVKGGDKDYNDMVIGVNFTKYVPTTSVPEPETYMLMLMGIGLIGFMAKRGNRSLV
ncbi:MAG TPA: PEP-CTERM sorting domain-containing protein [Methyloradius sp.]